MRSTNGDVHRRVSVRDSINTFALGIFYFRNIFATCAHSTLAHKHQLLTKHIFMTRVSTSNQYDPTASHRAPILLPASAMVHPPPKKMCHLHVPYVSVRTKPKKKKKKQDAHALALRIVRPQSLVSETIRYIDKHVSVIRAE